MPRAATLSALRERLPHARGLQSGDFDRRDRLLEGAWSITRQRSRSQPGGVARRPGCDRYFRNCRPR